MTTVRRGSRAGLALALIASAACGTGKASARDSAGLAASGGIIADSGAVPMRVADYRLSEDRMDEWRGAQRAVSELPVDADFKPMRLADATDDDVERTMRYISERPDMRSTIERSGLTVRDYVLTTLALARADLVTRRPADSARFIMVPENRAFAARFGNELRATPAGGRFRVIDDADIDSDGADSDGGDRERKRKADRRDDDSDSGGHKGRGGKAKGRGEH